MTGDDRFPRPTELAPGDLVHVADLGPLLITGDPQVYTQPSGQEFVVVDAVRGRRRPAPVVIDFDAEVRRLPQDLRLLDFDIDPPGGGVREIRAWSRRRIVGSVSWREDDGTLVDVDPASPHDPLHGFLLFAARDQCPHLQHPDPAAHWTPDPASLSPGELIVVEHGAPLLVVASPQPYRDPQGVGFLRVDTLLGDQPVAVVLTAETDWRRERFDHSAHRLDAFPADGGRRTMRARNPAGVTVGEITWSPFDGAVTAIRPRHPLHPLHRLLADRAADPQGRIDATTDPATLEAGDTIISEDREVEILGPAERDDAGYLAYPILYRDSGEESTMMFDPTVPAPRRAAVADR